VNFLIKRDKKKVFKFASFQTSAGKKLTGGLRLPKDPPDSLIFVDENGYYLKSTACLNIIKYLSSPVKILYVLYIIPVPLRDFIYDLIANNRYRLFGKRNACRMPAESDKDRFIT